MQFIQRYIGEHRYAPFIREIQQGCQIASYKSIIDRLNSLEHKGWIKRIPSKHRGIRLRRAPAPTPVEPQPPVEVASLEGMVS